MHKLIKQLFVNFVQPYYHFMKSNNYYMKYFIILSIILISCSNSVTFESRVKNYMKDSVAVNLDDPKSYEFVSAKIDTFKVKDYIKNLSTPPIFDSVRNNNILDSLSKLSPEQIIHIEVEVKARAKNKLGALVMNTLNLRLDPTSNKFYLPE